MNWLILSIFLITSPSYANECIDCVGVGLSGNQNFPKMPNIPNYDKALMALQADPSFPKFQFTGGGFGFPGSGMSQQDSNNLVKDYDKGVNKLLKYLPESSLKNGLKKYLEIINAKSYANDDTVGASNAGIAAFNQNSLESNPCFAKLAEAFYTEILEKDSSQQGNYNQGSKKEELYGRPSLSTESGKGKHKDLTPGWLYEKALEYSGGDSNLALNLIAVCGHDDTAQGMLSYRLEVDSKSQTSKDDLLSILDYQIETNQFNLKSQDENYKLYKENPEEYKKNFPI